VLIPTLFFGIPGSGGMAIFLAMLVLYGFQPGPAMLSTHLDMTMSFVITIAFANIIVVPIMLWCSPLIVKLSAIPPNTLAPVVISVVTLGAFQASSSMGDILATAIFGTIGIFMKRYGWPRPPILIAVVLAEPLEKYMWLSINTWGWSMFARPQFLIIFAFMAAFVAVSMWVHAHRSWSARKAIKPSEAGQVAMADTAVPTSDLTRYAGADDLTGVASTSTKEMQVTSVHRRALSVEIAGEIVLLLMVGGFFVYVLVLSLDWSVSAALMPYIALIIGAPFLVIRIVHVMRAFFGIGSRTMSTRQIMDFGFRIGDDPVNEYRRFVMIIVAIGILYIGLWLVGFHIMLPLWTFLYMHFVGKTRLIWSVSVSLIMLGVIVGVYDYLVGAIWNEPLLLSLFR
jgi:hypothetical protein